MSDQVMASLPVRRKPMRSRWAWALVAGALLIVIGLHWVLAPNVAMHETPKLAKSTPKLFTPKQPVQVNKNALAKALSEPEAPKRRIALVPKGRHQWSNHMVQHQQVPKLRKPVRQPELPKVYRVAMRNERIGARVETTIMVTVGDAVLCRTKLTTIDLPSNKDADVERPPLEVNRTDNAAVMQRNGG